MGEVFVATVDRFDGGIRNDPRESSEGTCRVVTNFDILTNRHKMTPYRDTEDGDNAASTSQKQNFCIALRTGTTYNLYALGRQSALNRAEVLMKSLTTGAATDLDDNGWATPNNNQSSVASPNFNLFVYYAKRNRIFGAEAGTTIFSFDPSSVAAWGDESHSLSYTTVFPGLVHSKDDILYIPYDNKIAKNDNNSWTDAALTLPTHLNAVSLEEDGGFLAVGAAPKNGIERSWVYLWDRNASLATLSESIDWGEGDLKILGELNGELVGISLAGANTTRFKDKVYFRLRVGSGFQEIAVLEGSTSTFILTFKQKANNRLYFLMSISLNGSIREGIWSIGRNARGLWTIVHESTPNNDTALGGGALKGFFLIGDYTFISSANNAGTFQLLKTNDTSSFTATAIWESGINPGISAEHRHALKRLLAVACDYEPLPANGQVVLKYKVDGGSFTTIFTETTDNALVTERPDIVGTPFTDSRELEFRVESTGGAVVTGLRYKYEVVETLV